LKDVAQTGTQNEKPQATEPRWIASSAAADIAPRRIGGDCAAGCGRDRSAVAPAADWLRLRALRLARIVACASLRGQLRLPPHSGPALRSRLPASGRRPIRIVRKSRLQAADSADSVCRSASGGRARRCALFRPCPSGVRVRTRKPLKTLLFHVKQRAQEKSSVKGSTREGKNQRARLTDGLKPAPHVSPAEFSVKAGCSGFGRLHLQFAVHSLRGAQIPSSHSGETALQPRNVSSTQRGTISVALP